MSRTLIKGVLSLCQDAVMYSSAPADRAEDGNVSIEQTRNGLTDLCRYLLNIGFNFIILEEFITDNLVKEFAELRFKVPLVGFRSLVEEESTYWALVNSLNLQNELMDVHQSDISKILQFPHFKLSLFYVHQISPLHGGLSRSPP